MRPRWSRSRFGYDHRWWREPERGERVEGRSVLVDHASAVALPGLRCAVRPRWPTSSGSHRLGVIRPTPCGPGPTPGCGTACGRCRSTDQWFLPLSLAVILIGWQAVDRRDWRFAPATLLGMAIESVVLAIALVGLSKVVDLGFTRLEQAGSTAACPPVMPGLKPPGGPLDRIPRRGGL